MMKWLLCILFLMPFYLSAQEEDSLLTALKNEKVPEKKADIYLTLLNYIAETDSIRAKEYIKEAEKLVPQSDIIRRSEILNSWGFLYLSKDPDKSVPYYYKALALLKNENSEKALNLKAKYWYNIAATEQRKGNIESAMKIVTQKSIPQAKKAPDQMYLANNYLMIGLIFYNEDNLEKAINYLQNADSVLQQLEKNTKTRKLITVTQLYLAEVYLKKEDYPTAKSKLNNAEEQLKKYPNYDIENEFYHLNSLYYFYTEDYPRALENVNKGLQLTEKYKNQYQLVRLTFIKAKILPYLNKHDEAILILKSMLKDEMYVTVYGKNISTIYEELSLVEESRGNYKEALAYANRRFEVFDSLNTEIKNSAVNEMETKFRTSEKEKMLAVKQLELNEKNQYMWISIVVSLLLLGAGLFTYFYYRKKRQLSQQREINLQQRLREKEKEEELKVTKAILDGEERERERVAKDLHDGLGGMLAGVKINLSTWSNSHLEENQYDSFHKILNQLDNSVSELRRVARNLMPESLLNFGLEIALQDLCEFYSQPDIKIDFQAMNIDKNLPLNLQINIYRIVQELLANAVKHSNASNIFLQCSQSQGHFFITIEDNGVGIKPNDSDKPKSMGLKNLTNRVNFMKGKMDILSEKNQGTTVNIELNVA